MPFHVQGREGPGDTDNPDGFDAIFFAGAFCSQTEPSGVAQMRLRKSNWSSGTTFARTPAARASGALFGRHLVLRIRIEVRGVVALVELAGGVARGAVDDAAALHGGPRIDLVGPAQHVLVFMRRQEFGCIVGPALQNAAIPRKNGDVGDRVF